MTRLRPFLSLAAIATGLLLCTCSSSDTTGPDTGDGTPQLLTVVPTEGLPGSVLNVTGLSISADSIQYYSAFIGGESAPLRLSGDSVIQVAVPLYFDSVSGWSNPPADSVRLEIRLGNILTGASEPAITVLDLPHADGTTEQIQHILDTLVTNIGILFSTLPTPNAWEQEYRDSLTSVLQSLVNGPDISLAAILNGSSSLPGGLPGDADFADAILASTGVLDYWKEYADAFSLSSSRLQQKIADLQAQSILCPDLGPDADLACQMQLYVLIHAWETEFIAATRAEWELSIGWVIDAIALIPGAAALPPVAVAKLIGAVLTITDVVVGNVVLSLLPSHISSFDMIVASETMNVDEFTNSRIFISGANTPERMTINEMVDLVMTAVGFKSTTAFPDFKLLVLNIVQFIVDKLRLVYTVLHSAAPDVFGDPALVDANYYAFPNMMWGPVEVTNHDLVELYSFEPGILEPDTAAFEWWSADCGEATIEVRTRGAGQRSKLVRDWLFCGLCQYNGGAFGEDAAITPSHHITVGQPGNMELVIDGLPSGELADVLVIFPDGATFQSVRESATLPELESGSYEVQANEVELSDGSVYVCDPFSRTVDVTCDSTVTVDITYEPKFGNIYLVVTGLYEGPPADIRIEGPDSYVLEVDGTTLIDSLLPGIYDVLAFEVDDHGGQTYVPEPDVSELIVERANTALLTIDYKPKFGYINMNIASLPAGIDADIDIVGPDGYFHHVTAADRIDSLLPGDYIINAYDIVDGNGDTLTPSPLSQVVTIVGGEEESVRVDYSGGHRLTVTFNGLPDGAPADVFISGPEGYTATVTSDTTLEGLPDGGPFNITSETIVFNNITYRPATPDTSIFVYSDRTMSLTYKARAVMSIYLGGVHENAPETDERAQMLIKAYSRTTNADTSITEDNFEPSRGSLPEQLSLDTCGFENGRLLLGGVSYYFVEAATATSSADLSLTFNVHDTTASVTIDGTIRIASPSDPANTTDRANASLQALFYRMLRVELYNPNLAAGSGSSVGITANFEIMNTTTQIGGRIHWYMLSHNCGQPWVSSTWLNDPIGSADSLQIFQSSTGGLAAGGVRREMDIGFDLSLGGNSRAGEPDAEATVHGEFQFILRQN